MKAVVVLSWFAAVNAFRFPDSTSNSLLPDSTSNSLLPKGSNSLLPKGFYPTMVYGDEMMDPVLTEHGYYLGSFHPKDMLGELKYTEIHAPTISLKSGQVENDVMKFPEFPSNVAIRYLETKIVDDDGIAVPLSELYMHHWFIMHEGADYGYLNSGLCAERNALPGYGTGAELNGQILTFPEPYALLTGDEGYLINQHMIRTTNMPKEKVQDCIECRCENSNPPLHPVGSHFCPHCLDKAQCWGMDDWAKDDFKNYTLVFKIGYVEPSDDIIPVTALSLDSTLTNSTDCKVEYNVPYDENNVVTTTTSDNVIPADFDITTIAVHQHTGGVNFTLEHWRDGKMLGVICDTYSIYGAVGGVTDGYLVGLPFCLYTADAPLKLKTGDIIRLIDIYDDRTLPGGTPWHSGVMGLVWIFGYTPTDLAGILREQHLASLPSDYFPFLVDGETYDVTPPNQVKGMEFTMLPDYENDLIFFTMVCPQKGWCGVALSEGNSMTGAIAFIYEPEDNNLSLRILGNHNPGTEILAQYPGATIDKDAGATIDKEGAAVTINGALRKSEFSTVYGGVVKCFLFAQGASSTLQYHTSTRGATCL